MLLATTHKKCRDAACQNTRCLNMLRKAGGLRAFPLGPLRQASKPSPARLPDSKSAGHWVDAPSKNPLCWVAQGAPPKTL